MDWTQLISLAGYTTAVCYFFYRLNEKSIEKNERRFFFLCFGAASKR